MNRQPSSYGGNSPNLSATITLTASITPCPRVLMSLCLRPHGSRRRGRREGEGGERDDGADQTRRGPASRQKSGHEGEDGSCPSSLLLIPKPFCLLLLFIKSSLVDTVIGVKQSGDFIFVKTNIGIFPSVRGTRNKSIFICCLLCGYWSLHVHFLCF